MYGILEIGGKKYIERAQIFTAQQLINVNLQVVPNLRLVLPGVANFLLKGLTRTTVVAGAAAARLFRFKLGNTDGANWYMSAGLGGANDRILDPLCFGDAQFPFPIIPGILYGASSSILYEVEDVSNNQPYTIFFAFHGSYLVPYEK